MSTEPLQKEKIVAKLSSKERNALPGKSFIFPGKRSYPIPDRSHAINAEARASGKPQEAAVRAAVHKKFPNIGGDQHNHNTHLHVHVHASGKKKFSL